MNVVFVKSKETWVTERNESESSMLLDYERACITDDFQLSGEKRAVLS